MSSGNKHSSGRILPLLTNVIKISNLTEFNIWCSTDYLTLILCPLQLSNQCITSFLVYFTTTAKICLDLRCLQKRLQIHSVFKSKRVYPNLMLATQMSKGSCSESISLFNYGSDLPECSNSEETENDDAIDNQVPTDLNPLGARFFGKPDNLEMLWKVNQEFKLPSWIGRVPLTVGAAKGGKLKADEWVLLFEIVMIPTLMHILKNKGPNVFRIGVFENILHLTSITNIIQSLEIDNSDIKALRIHIKAHCQGLRDIFPTFSTKPNNHLALVLPDCLKQFGPAPHWMVWSFERLDGSLAAAPTNNHIGKHWK